MLRNNSRNFAVVGLFNPPPPQGLTNANHASIHFVSPYNRPLPSTRQIFDWRGLVRDNLALIISIIKALVLLAWNEWKGQ